MRERKGDLGDYLGLVYEGLKRHISDEVQHDVWGRVSDLVLRNLQSPRQAMTEQFLV